MSNNNREYILPEGEILVSETDLAGNITFADDNFVRVSGFTREELKGKPHNLVRHPDMPKEAFKDLWKNISAEKSWSGILKNRQKKGGFYWVKSDVIPLYNGGEHTGFMSVRSAPNSVQLERAKKLYPLFKAGEQGNLIFKNGKVVKKTKQKWTSSLTIKQRIQGLVLFATMSLLLILATGIYSAFTEKEAVEDLYQSHVKESSQLKSMASVWQESKYLLKMSLLTGDSNQLLSISNTLQDKANQLNAVATELIATIDSTNVDKESWGKAIAVQRDYIGSISPSFSLLATPVLSDSTAGVPPTEIADIINNIEQFERDITAMIDINYQQAQVVHQLSDQVLLWEIVLSITLTLLCIFFYVLIAYHFNKDIQSRLHKIKQYFNKLVMQDYLFDIDVKNHDEIGEVLQSLKIMKVQLAFNMEKMKQTATTATRIKIALDNVSTNVMIADNERNIIYANPAIIKMFKQSESVLKAAIPHFNAGNIVGASIDQFHTESAEQANTLSKLTQANSKVIVINGCTFNTITNPVTNDNGERIGSVGEWTDRTLEIAIEQEIESVIQAAVNGDFTQRMDLSGKNGFYTVLSESINRLLEITEDNLADIVTVLSALAKGDLTANISGDYSGAFGELKDSSNLTVSKLKEMIIQIKVSADTINTAAKEIAIGNVDLAQRTEKQASSLEVTASSMEELTITVKQNSEHAKQANRLAKETSENAIKGGDIVKKVVNNMSVINTSSREIMNIISVIDSIAFQTNILALNAAVEAARAGEQGRGFAVVATEVRNLAQRSATAAKEVKTLINSSVEKIEIGSKLADQAGDSISGVVSSIHDVANIIEEITSASIEQSIGIEQVGRAILEIDDVTQQNSALVEEGSAAASSLEEQVANLAISVAVFDTGKGHLNRSAHSHSMPAKPHRETLEQSTNQEDDAHDWSEF
ncbi:methyl-accepting chemotaxis protein [Shewanella sp. DAU334]|uniref:Methyl-accepting chemotaxis protein n=1 Tax=Shewanella youngdeokensis TaxID=2999068 RepID=A0ABZ0K2Y6_9GAMM|nr:methyl-accepting chemotaxis protein [Shewanella sp. DAU334]